MAIQIGWVVVENDFEITNRSFECAAWHETIKVPAGKYPLNAARFTYNYAEQQQTNEIDYNSVSAKLVGEVVGSDFTSHFGGVAYGSKVDKNVGQTSQYYLNPYAYSVAENVLKGGNPGADYKYELLPEFEAKRIDFISSYDNKPCTTHGIFKKSEVRSDNNAN